MMKCTFFLFLCIIVNSMLFVKEATKKGREKAVGVTMICDSGSGSGGKHRRVSHRSHCKAAATAAEKKNSEQETIVLL